MSNVELYTKGHCPYCHRAKALLTQKGQHVGGCDEMMALEAASKLDPMLGLA